MFAPHQEQFQQCCRAVYSFYWQLLQPWPHQYSKHCVHFILTPSIIVKMFKETCCYSLTRISQCHQGCQIPRMHHIFACKCTLHNGRNTEQNSQKIRQQPLPHQSAKFFHYNTQKVQRALQTFWWNNVFYIQRVKN